MPLYKDDTLIKLFEFGYNEEADFFWWAKNKDRTLTIFEFKNQEFIFRKSDTFEKTNFIFKTNIKIGKAKTEEELKNIFLNSKYKLRIYTNSIKEVSFAKEEEEEDDFGIEELIKMSV